MGPTRHEQAANETDLAGIRDEAAAWIVCLDEAGPDERERLEADCEAWLAGDDRRRRVLEQMRKLWSAVEPGRKRRRRTAVTGLVVALAALLAGQVPWHGWTSDHRTAAGEIREVTLPDGSIALLDTATAIDVDYDDGARRIHLEHGRLLVKVRDNDAPFRVMTEHGAATALGTRYGVRTAGDHAAATVYESRIRLVPRDAGDRAVTLAAGQRARLRRDEVRDIEPTKRGRPDWADGRLVFNDARLAEVIERLRRYRSGWLLLDDALAGDDRRFTGVLPAEDSDTALAVLADALSLRVQRFTPYVVRVERGP